jgi:GAF domain-containing protein
MRTTTAHTEPDGSDLKVDQLDVLTGEQPLPRVLETLLTLARVALPPDVYTSITLVRGDEARTAAFSGAIALTLDERQYEQGFGPCLDAANAGEVIYVPEMQNETRWAEFATAAHEAGINSSLSVPLPVQRQMTGALNIYSPQSDSFDADTIEIAESFANHAAVAVATAHSYETAAALAAQMRQAMESRATIEQAKGILMREHRCGPEAAFERLVHLSQTSHLKLRELAARLVAHVSSEAADVPGPIARGRR